MVQIQELQDKVNSFNDAKEFYDPETTNSSGVSHVPSPAMSIPSPRGMISRDSCLQSDTRNPLATSGNVFEGLLARSAPSSAFFGNSKNFAPSSCRLKPIDTGQNCGQEPQSLYNTNSSLCQEVFDLESFLSCRRDFSSKLHDGKSEESDLGTAFR